MYDLFALFFDVLMIPFLRDSTSLEKKFRKICVEWPRNLLESILVFVFHNQVVLAWASGKVVEDNFFVGSYPRFNFR